MTPDIDIYRAAKLLVDHHGEDAPIHATTRADALSRLHGVFVKDSAKTRRYLGTIRASAANTAADTETQRFVWNSDNRVGRELRVLEATNEWNYTTDTFRAANNSTTNRVEVVTGLAYDLVTLTVMAHFLNGGTGVAGYPGIGKNSTTVTNAYLRSSTNTQNASTVIGAVSLLSDAPMTGYRFYQWTERSVASGVTTWYGDNGTSDRFQSGMVGVTYA